MKIATLFVRYGTEQYADAESRIDALFRQQMPEIERDVLVIDNQLSENRQVQSSTVLCGDNHYWEFSGWDQGIRYLGASLWSYDWIHFATSAAFQSYTGYLERFSAEQLKIAHGLPVAIGHLDCFNEPVRFLSCCFQSWLRTSFFFLQPAEVANLGSMVSISYPERFFSDDHSRPFRKDAPISTNYRAFILGWLTRSGTGQGMEWHSRFELNAVNLDYFKQKALSILNEHMLSIRLRALGCNLVDTTWLSTVFEKKQNVIPWRTRWEAQLRNRSQIVG